MKVLREYQRTILDNIKTDISSGVKNIVMAMCPNAGKTFTTIKLLEELFNEGKIKKVLVLAHGTTVLRDQFYKSLIENKPSFTISSITQESKDSTGQVVVAIPQGLDGINLTEFDLLVVDEAHERFLAKEGKVITKKIGAKHNILLTGTPSKFIHENIKKENYRIHLVAMSDIDSEYMANAQIFICSSKYTFKDEDYSNDEDLKANFKFTKDQTENSLDELVQQMVKILKMKKINNLDNFYPIAFNKLQKTMIVCKRQNQAKQVFNYLNKKGIKSTISTQDTDLDSDNIQTFIEDDSVRVLIVVGRGILGFNLPTLVNVVDMSGTRNLDRMYQIFSRITRVHKDHPIKRYFKLAPVGEVEYTQYVASAMLSLIHRDNMSIYNGKNFKTDLPILVTKESKDSSETSERGESSGKSSQKVFEFEGLDVMVTFTRLYSNMDKALQIYSKINLQEAMVELGKYGKQLPSGWWTRERVIEESKKYSSLLKFRKGNPGAYDSSYRIGMNKEIIELNNWNYRIKWLWNKKLILQKSKECLSLQDFKIKYPGGEYRMRKLGIVEDVLKVNNWNKKESWTKEKILAESKKYKSFTRFIDSKIYRAALSRNLIENIIKLNNWERGIKSPGHWTKEKVLAESKKYKSLLEFTKNAGGAYKFSLKENLINEILNLNNWNKSSGPKKIFCFNNSIEYDSIVDAAKGLGLHASGISNQLRKKQKSAGGYTFKYVDEE